MRSAKYLTYAFYLKDTIYIPSQLLQINVGSASLDDVTYKNYNNFLFPVVALLTYIHSYLFFVSFPFSISVPFDEGTLNKITLPPIGNGRLMKSLDTPIFLHFTDEILILPRLHCVL